MGLFGMLAFIWICVGLILLMQVNSEARTVDGTGEACVFPFFNLVDGNREAQSTCEPFDADADPLASPAWCPTRVKVDGTPDVVKNCSVADGYVTNVIWASGIANGEGGLNWGAILLLLGARVFCVMRGQFSKRMLFERARYAKAKRQFAENPDIQAHFYFSYCPRHGFAEDDHYLARMDHVFGNSAFDAVFVAPDVRSTLAW